MSEKETKIWVHMGLDWVRKHVGDAMPISDIMEGGGYRKKQLAYQKALDSHAAGLIRPCYAVLGKVGVVIYCSSCPYDAAEFILNSSYGRDLPPISISRGIHGRYETMTISEFLNKYDETAN